VPKAYAYRINNQGKHKIKMPKEIKKILKAPNKNQEEAERTDEMKGALEAGRSTICIDLFLVPAKLIHTYPNLQLRKFLLARNYEAS